MAKAFEIPKDFSRLIFLSEKGRHKNFALTIPLYFCKVFEITKDFLQKVLWSGFGAEAPTDNAHTKKHGNAVLFLILSMYVGTAVRGPCFKELLKKLLKNPQNFRTEYNHIRM